MRKRLDALLAQVHGIANQADHRLELIGLLEEGGESLHRFALALRENVQGSTLLDGTDSLRNIRVEANLVRDRPGDQPVGWIESFASRQGRQALVGVPGSK